MNYCENDARMGIFWFQPKVSCTGPVDLVRPDPFRSDQLMDIGVSAVSNGKEGEPSAWLAAHAAGRRWSESWMRYPHVQFDEGVRGNVRQRNAPVPYSTEALA